MSLEYPALREMAPLVQQLPQEERPFPRWMRVASQLGGVAVVAGFGIASQLCAAELNEQPLLLFGLGVTAGAVRPLIATRIAPNRFDSSFYSFLSTFDVPIFLALTLGEQLTKQIPYLRNIWIPLIFLHEGSVVSWGIGEKWKETKEEFPLDPIDRPLYEGDIRGAAKPFLLKGALLATAGAVSAVAGGLTKSVAAWRLGFIGIGMGTSVPALQRIYAALKEMIETYQQQSPAERLVKGVPVSQRLLTLISRLSPPVGKAAVCSAGALLILFPNSVAQVDIEYALINVPIGLAFALIDLGRQDEFQYPKKKEPSATCWQNVKKNPSLYFGAALTVSTVTGFWVSRLVDPSLGSLFDASLVLGGTAVTCLLAKGVDAFCKPGLNRAANQINFRATCSSHLFALIFFSLLSSDSLGALTTQESRFMWGFFGAYIGLFLKGLFD